jgi:hypothetical protein
LDIIVLDPVHREPVIGGWRAASGNVFTVRRVDDDARAAMWATMFEMRNGNVATRHSPLAI